MRKRPFDGVGWYVARARDVTSTKRFLPADVNHGWRILSRQLCMQFSWRYQLPHIASFMLRLK